MAAQATDARVQRETNFINTILNGDTASVGPSSHLSHQSSHAKRPPRWEVPVEELHTVEEREPQKDHSESSKSRTENTGLEPHPEEEENDDDVKPGDEAAGISNIPVPEEAVYPEDLQPLLQNLVEEEIYNHTVWSVIRTHHRALPTRRAQYSIQVATLVRDWRFSR
ncbi:hypothetical protein TMatcc_000624 [Talaromyces marneffei ATCC 18224]|uniref:Uncharacterized protein n=1 Tax=Talaromyces marneffei PM1 TaxID=1077442 RepID=A0A093VA01_TALMA|nr:uncharacterized protein EYB26_003189 [Talaromyces marneffei]KAE8549606.1 hypothetical protein EYB25_008128 [Talaromyces marneffei]QGA15531.1 hypothetical protein EYB26_003189 [Talaromyces marneffei]